MSSSSETVMTAAEYAESVNQWLQQAYQWQVVALGFPTYLAYQASLRAQQQQSPPDFTSAATGRQQQQPPPEQRQPQPAAAPPTPREFSIPPIWKRFAAEFLDFMSLFFLKLLVTFVAVDTFELIDFDSFIRKYDSSLQSFVSGEELDVTTAFELTSEIVMLEMIHRIVVCTFETICTFRGPLGSAGGATPGKLIMGLRIFRCDEIIMTPDPQRVRIVPASDLGLFWAGLRSVLKNMSMAFLFPVCITFMFLPYNRTIYDVMSRSIVVEVGPPQRRQQQRRRDD